MILNVMSFILKTISSLVNFWGFYFTKLESQTVRAGETEYHVAGNLKKERGDMNYVSAGRYACVFHFKKKKVGYFLIMHPK